MRVSNLLPFKHFLISGFNQKSHGDRSGLYAGCGKVLSRVSSNNPVRGLNSGQGRYHVKVSDLVAPVRGRASM